MKRLTFLAVATIALMMGLSKAEAAVKFWDINGTEAGATPGANGIGDGTWDTTNTNWNLNADGTGATTSWAEGDDAVFAAGNDLSPNVATGGAFVVISGSHTPNSLTIEEGFVDFSTANGIAMGANPITIKQGATLSIPNQNVITATAGQIVTFDGGTIENHIIGAGSSFYNAGAATRWQLTSNGGTVFTPNGGTALADPINGTYSIMQYGSLTAASIVECAPGSASCTLHKTGHGEFRASKDWTMTAVDVQMGLYRISNSTTNGGESGFGAPNGTVTVAGGAVENTTNGAALGTTARLTNDTGGVGPSPATRSFVLSGVGDTPDSMFVLNDNWQILGPVSGSGGLMLNGWARNDGGGATNIIGTQNELRLGGNNTYGGKTTINFGTIVAQNGSAIPNTSRVQFSTRSGWGGNAGGVVTTLDQAILRVDASETVGSLAGGNGTRGSANINGAAVTLTTGADGTTSTFSGSIIGTGGLTKSGGGTFTMDGVKSYTGNTAVTGGTLSTNSASLADAANVSLTSGAFFNLNFAGTDAINSLFIDSVLQSAGVWGAIGSGAAHETARITGTGFLNAAVGPGVGIPGDYNSDGKVDAQDYVLWRKTPASYGGDPGGYTTWRANFSSPPGAGSGLSGGAVPEPCSLVLLLASAAAIAAFRRR